MSRVHLLTAATPQPSTPRAHAELEAMVALAGQDRFGEHTLVASPEKADVILFVEHSTDAGAYFQDVRRHEVHRRYRDRCYLFCSTDRVIPFLPGVYAAIERRWYRGSWVRSGPYLGVEIDGGPATGPPNYLFSFVGTPHSAPVRKQIVALRHPRGLIRDTAVANRNSLSRAEFTATLRDSAFVLCPRGGGTSSIRLFETLALGRVPVIVSDQWVPPVGPDWTAFSLRVPESEVRGIPTLLQDAEASAAAMGRLARQAWEEWFAPDVLFHRTVQWCLEIAAQAPARGPLIGAWPYLQLLRPYHALRWAARTVGHGSWRLPPALYKLLGVPTQ